MQMLLDTAVLVFAVEAPERLSKRVAAVLQNRENVFELSPVSLVEIAIKTTLGKLAVSADIARQAIADLDIRALPFTVQHAFRLIDLPLHHTDPFDRQIIAQALVEKIPVAAPDEKFRLYPGLKITW
jgi:PIN domain nuclease of toxin-antitoxin system